MLSSAKKHKHPTGEPDLKVIFLDIDGVMNAYPMLIGEFGCDYIHDPMVKTLARIIRETDAMICLSSSWRFGAVHIVKEKLEEFGIADRLIGMTRLVDDNPRAENIQNWLDANPEVTTFAILDDCADAGYNGLGHSFFMTDADVGLTEVEGDEIIIHLNRPAKEKS